MEAVSGGLLLAAAAAALIWANSPFAHSYHVFWNLPLAIGVGEQIFSRSLHFWVNDALMTMFFLVAGMEIRREIHEGALSRIDQAILPLIAAIGGVIVPALIYLGLNSNPERGRGWAVPMATDIAFAVGVLALLGRKVPANVRVFLLALAIIDDIIAVLVIAVFYTTSLHLEGFAVSSIGVLAALGFQRIGIGSALAYFLPGALVWFGFTVAGIHPTLAGVLLGLMTPARSIATREQPLEMVSRVLGQLRNSEAVKAKDPHRLQRPLRDLRLAHREILPPVSRVQMALHPWVAYGVMPIFAVANAGVGLTGIDLSGGTEACHGGRRDCVFRGEAAGRRRRDLVGGANGLESPRSRRLMGWPLPGWPAGGNRVHHVDLHLDARLRRRGIDRCRQARRAPRITGRCHNRPRLGRHLRSKSLRATAMAFDAPHVSFVSFAVEVLPSGIAQVMIVETGLHLNPKHPSYDQPAVEALILAAQNHVSAHVEGPASIRLVSTRSCEI